MRRKSGASPAAPVLGRTALTRLVRHEMKQKEEENMLHKDLYISCELFATNRLG